MTIGYLICLIAAVGLLIAYWVMVKNKEFWLSMLYVCVVTVNLGYLLTSISKTVEMAIFGNDVAYFGSVFLCTCMFLTIVRLCGFEIKKVHVIPCISLAVVMFAIIVSSPMIPLYYESVYIEVIDGATKLVKEYGVLHPLYMVYLLGYFAVMIGTIIHSVRKKKIGNPKLAGFILAVVCGNIVMWLFEKLVSWEYEFLSVMYIVSELLLLIVYWMMQDYVRKDEVPTPVVVESKAPILVVETEERAKKIELILSRLPESKKLSVRQLDVLEGMICGKSRKEIAADLHLSENTVKMHVSALFKALGVKSREELYALL